MNRFASIALALCVLASGAGWTALDYAGVAGVKRQVTGGGEPWTPTDLSTPSYYWFALNETNTMVLVATNGIAKVPSKGSNTNAMFAGAYYPLVTNDAVSGLACAMFAGTSQRGWSLPTYIEVPTNGAPYTFIAAYDRPNGGAPSLLWSSVDPVYGQPAMHWVDNKIYSQMHAAYRVSSNTYGTGRAILATTGTGIEAGYTVRRTGASVALTAPSASAAATSIRSVGFYSAASSRYHSGMMFELLYVPTNLPSTDVEKLEGYLAHKWGFSTSLPTNHPYYNAAP
jgi:hypothetical protein